MSSSNEEVSLTGSGRLLLKSAKSKIVARSPDVVKSRFDARKIRRMKDEELDVHFECCYLEDILDAITTGDIFLMSGTELFSRVIKRATLTTWSHIGMAVVNPPREVVETLAIPEHWDSTVFIFESDTETWDKREGGGVQLVCLKEYLRDIFEFYGPSFLFIWRSIVIPHGISEEFWVNHPKFAQWLINQRGKGYKTAKKELARSVLRTNRQEDMNNYFCSEIIALAYMELKLLRSIEEGGRRANNFVPRDFSSSQRFSGKDILLLRDAYFERERRIKLKSQAPEQKTQSEPILTTSPSTVPANTLTDSAPGVLPID